MTVSYLRSQQYLQKLCKSLFIAVTAALYTVVSKFIKLMQRKTCDVEGFQKMPNYVKLQTECDKILNVKTAGLFRM